jgi:plastocyanin
MIKLHLFIFLILAMIGTVVYSETQGNIPRPTYAKDAANVHMVSLLKNRADPEIVIVRVGDYVQFNARDGREHNLSQGSGNAVEDNHAHKETGLESGVFKSDEAYKIQFKKVGIYSFHDHNNPDTYIRVIVDDRK